MTWLEWLEWLDCFQPYARKLAVTDQRDRAGIRPTSPTVQPSGGFTGEPRRRSPGTRRPRATPALRGSPFSPPTLAAVLALVAILTATSRAKPSAAAMPSVDPRSVADLPDPPAFRLDSTPQRQFRDCPAPLLARHFAHLHETP